MRKIRSIGWAAAMAALLTGATPSLGAGLRTPFGEVIVKNIKIGQTYSLYKLLNLPFRVVNTGKEETDVTVEVVRVSTEELRQPYEPLGSLDWVRLEKSTFTVAPNHEAATDLIISVPNDPALLGRRFEADILSRTVSHNTYAVALLSRLLIHVDSTPPSEEELKKKFVDATIANLDFTVLPVNAAVSDIAVGRPVDLRKERKIVIKLINPNETPISFRIRSIPSWESELRPPAGFEDPLDPKWLKPEKDIVKVDGNSIGEESMTLSIPDDERYRAKNYFFLLNFEVLEQRIPVRVYYRLLVATEPKKKAAAAPAK